MKLVHILLGVILTPLLFAAGEHDDKKSEMKHAHMSWTDAPMSYMSYKNESTWSDPKSAQRGKQVYQQNCLSCHGKNGEGDGPVASSLDHAPADLTNNFHEPGGKTDAYLFWRVSEGGMVEPFRSQNSVMPAFKTALNEKQRWDVLSYVHQNFHKENQSMSSDMEGNDSMMEHQDDEGMNHQ